MRMLQLINAGIWAAFTLASLILAIATPSFFTISATFVCGGIAAGSFLLYRWEQSYEDDDDRGW